MPVSFSGRSSEGALVSEFRGKIVLITGGSRGIGRAIAMEFGRLGATVIINYLRNLEAAREAQRELRKLGRKSLLLQANVGNADEVEELFVSIKKTFGRLDLFIHCASLGIFKPLLELNQLQIGRVMAIHCGAFIACARRAAPLMKNGGAMVALSSLGSQRFVAHYGAIGISKAGLEAAVKYVAVELANKNIRVNAVSGGPVRTKGLREIPGYLSRKKECERRTPYGRLGTPEDIANVISFLCSKKSAWICGQTITVDGGLSLRLLAH